MRPILMLPFLLFPMLARADDSRPVVVELFTSQGCSSCPPADRLLSDLAARPDVLALAWHIDYWDRLGWADPFSLPGATARQRDYAGWLGLRTVYTPEIVVDGQRDVIGSRRDAVLAAIDAARGAARGAAPPVGIRFGAGRGTDIIVDAGAGSGTVLRISFDRSHTTAVRAGENGGRVLTDAHVVRTVEPLASWSGEALTLSRPLPPGAGNGVAVLLQGPDGRILGAARDLP